MSQTEKENLETRTVPPLQIITKNAIEETDAVDDYIEVALKKRKREAEVPLYLKRV
jgi:hypothetical protein